MLICMRTTLDLDDHLLRHARKRAAETGRTLTSVIEEALRERFSGSRAVPASKFRLRWKAVSGKLRTGVDLTDRDSLYERMEGRS